MGEEMKSKPGVVTLPSGLMYKVLREGTGEDHPTADSSCECFYAGTTPSLTPNAHEVADDTEALNKEWNDFDSGYKRGSTTSFAPNQVIKGWTEAMQLMVEGDKWEMYIPSELGYGDGGSGQKIKGGDVLIFRMEILKILGGKKRAYHCNLKTKENCDPDEVAILEKWASTDLKTLEKEVDKLKKKQQVLKPGQHEVIKAELSMLKKIVKAKKKDEL